MKSIVCLLVGVAGGVLLARSWYERSCDGDLFADIDRRARDFGSAVSDGFRAREAELRTEAPGD